jgi:hypothetical protein
MLRIMTWNIQSFGVNKFLPKKPWDMGGLRGKYIIRTIKFAHPDVLVVVEVRTSQVGFGALCAGPAGPAGVQTLLVELEGLFPKEKWSVVPPLIVSPAAGYAECVAVFYNAKRLQFTGPLMWNGKKSVKPVAGGGAPYAPPWNAALPARMTPLPLGVKENRLAGQHEFFNGAVRWNFPGPASRSLWLTRFTDLMTNRQLSLFALHFPPKPHRARGAFRRLAKVNEVTAALLPEEDRVIVGDFNINSKSPHQAKVFQRLTGGPGVALGPVGPYAQLFGQATALKRVFEAFPKRYLDTDPTGIPRGIDNAFVARGGALPANNQVVVNRVVGTPGPPIKYPRSMADSIAEILLLPPGAPQTQRFRTLVNFGHIGGAPGASDHMPIVFELP